MWEIISFGEFDLERILSALGLITDQVALCLEFPFAKINKRILCPPPPNKNACCWLCALCLLKSDLIIAIERDLLGKIKWKDVRAKPVRKKPIRRNADMIKLHQRIDRECITLKGQPAKVPMGRKPMPTLTKPMPKVIPMPNACAEPFNSPEVVPSAIGKVNSAANSKPNGK